MVTEENTGDQPPARGMSLETIIHAGLTRPGRPTHALVLMGGGARTAYQVGVLEGIADLRRDAGASGRANPFPIITGTSAGAINAATLACGADDFDAAVRRIRSSSWTTTAPGRRRGLNDDGARTTTGPAPPRGGRRAPVGATG